MYKILQTYDDELLIPIHDFDSVKEQYQEMNYKKRLYASEGKFTEMYTMIGYISKLLENYMSYNDNTLVVMPECDYNTTLQGIMSKNSDVPMYVTHDEIYPNYLSISSSYIAEYYRGDAESGDASDYACYGSEPWHAKPHLLLATGWRIISVR